MKSFFKKVITNILIFESKLIIKKYNPFIISITGSVGKTSTKDAIFTVLSDTTYVRKSEKSFNSEIGVPLTILGCQNGWSDPIAWIENILVGLELILFKSEYPKCLVLEVGADHPGDIQSVSKWLKSDIVVITKIGEVPVHIEAFPTVADLVKEKSFLIKTLKSDGVLVLSADDKLVIEMSKGVSQKCISYGMKQIATVNASDPVIIYDNESIPMGMSFKINTQGNSVPIKIKGILGLQQIYPVIAGIAVGITKNVPLVKIINSLDKHVSPRGRMNILRGINGSTIIDDSYNSSPDALKEGLNTLASLQVSGKRIAVIGDMMELGSFSIEEHKKAGIQAMQSCDILITVGQRSKVMSNNAIKFNNSIEASEYLKGTVASGDVVFVKGSQSMRMERICKVLLRDGENATDLLVRQEPEWLAKK